MTQSSYRYLRIHTLFSDSDLAVLREYQGPDDYRVERWDPATRAWVIDPEALRYTVLGEPNSDEIDEGEADAMIERLQTKFSHRVRPGPEAGT